MNRFILLMYDIPQDSGIANPSTYFWQFGARIRLSDWVFPESCVPYQYLHEMHRMGAKWDVVAFDSAENGKIVEMATKAIQHEIESVRERTRVTCNRAAVQAENDPACTDTLKSFRKKAASALKKCRASIRSLEQSSTRFGVRSQVAQRLTDAGSYCDGIKGLMLQRMQTLAESIRTLETSNHSVGEALAPGLRNGTTPTAIIADFLEEEIAKSALAKKLRTVFTDYDNLFR